MSRRKAWILVVAGVLVLGAGAALLWPHRADIGPGVAAFRDGSLEWLRSVPRGLYVAAFVVLPALGFPLTLFYLTAPGLFGGPNGLWGILIAWTCLGANMSLHYALVRVFRSWALRILARGRVNVGTLESGQQVRMILLLRASPTPYALQNIALAAAGIPFGRYLAFSWPVQGIIGLGIMLLGESLFRGGFQAFLLAVTVILLLWVFVPLIRRRLARGRPVPGLPEEGEA